MLLLTCFEFSQAAKRGLFIMYGRYLLHGTRWNAILLTLARENEKKNKLETYVTREMQAVSRKSKNNSISVCETNSQRRLTFLKWRKPTLVNMHQTHKTTSFRQHRTTYDKQQQRFINKVNNLTILSCLLIAWLIEAGIDKGSFNERTF